jgi:hypothetical protein
METLIVIARFLSDSLCQAQAQIAVKSLTSAGDEGVVENLYGEGISPALTGRLLLWQPVRRILKTALLGTCAPACRFGMLSLYQAEKLDSAQVQRFSSRIEKALARWS